MTRPTRPNIDNGTVLWDGPANDAHIQLYDRPAPIGELHAGTLASLDTARTPSAYDQCLAWAWYGAASGSGFVPAINNGTNWVPISNWIAARKAIVSVTSARTVQLTDDVLLTSGSGTFVITLPTADASNEGREIEIIHGGTGVVTVSGSINGSATFGLASQYDILIVRSDGAGDWKQISGGGGGGGGVTTFTGLTDTPANFTGAGSRTVKVNSGATALEFVDVPAQVIPLIVAVGDETTAITTGTAKVTFRAPAAFTVTDVRASLTTVSSSGVVTVDINEGGTSILSTKLTIDAGEKTSETAATAEVISDTTLADDAEITIDIDTAGTGAAGLKVTILGTM